MTKTLNLKLVLLLEYQNKNIFGYVPNWSEKVFVIKKIIKIAPWTYVFSDLKDEKIAGTFYKKE